jgi:RND family efflux transporter MFP subunit
VESLTTSLKVAELQLMAAEKTLADLQGSSASGLASARLAVEEAKDAVADAESALKTKGLPRCDKDTTDAYYSVYLRAKDSREALSDEGGTTGEYYLAVIVPAKDAEANAYAAYRYCAKFSDYEIAASEAELTLARAALKIAEEDLAMMLENKGIDPQELAGADNDVSAARLSYEQALKNLEGSTMRAPFDGTILSVAGETGETVGTTTFIVIADLLHPQVQFSVDETDLDKVSVGNGAEVIFDALPERVFEGQVVQVDPSLQTSSGYSVLQGLISLDLSAEANPKLFVVGMSGAVDVIGGEALDALLVPIEAVRDLGDGSYGVFVLDDDGKPRLRVVEVGLMDATYAEIKTGLEQGDTVTTGAVETNS